MDEGEEIPGSLLVARRHAAERLELLPEPFPQVTVLILLLVVLPLLGAVAARRDHRLCPFGFDRPHQPSAVVALVADDHLDRQSASISFSAWVTSASCPAVRMIRTGSISPLTAAWILVQLTKPSV